MGLIVSIVLNKYLTVSNLSQKTMLKEGYI